MDNNILWPIIITNAVVLSIGIASIAHHCWCRQASPGDCPFCHCKLDLPDLCLRCGAKQIHIKLGG